MKRLIYLSLAMFLIFGTTTTDAQIFKKLKKQVEKKVEDAVVKNVSDKAADETEKSLNNFWEKQAQKSPFSMGMDMVDPSEIPASYDFDWEYTLKVDSPQQDQDMHMVYHLKEGAPYTGIKIPQAENMFTVLDTKNEMTVMYMNSEGNKMVMAMKNPKPEEVMDPENPYKDMKFEKIGKKTILGYECQGYKSENEDHVYEFYVTDEAGISFTNLYHENQKNLPEGLDAEWLKEKTGLLMEMQMNDKTDPSKNMSMVCTGVEKKPFSIATADYQSMGGK